MIEKRGVVESELMKAWLEHQEDRKWNTFLPWSALGEWLVS